MGINLDIKDPENFFSKIPYKSILAVITMCVAALLFIPDAWLTNIFLLDMRNKYATVIGVVFLLCVALWLVILFLAIKDTIKKRRFCSDKACKQRFDLLSEEALQVVLDMYHSDRHAAELELGSAELSVLESMFFIGRSTVSSYAYVYGCYLQPWVIQYLSKHISEYE